MHTRGRGSHKLVKKVPLASRNAGQTSDAQFLFFTLLRMESAPSAAPASDESTASALQAFLSRPSSDHPLSHKICVVPCASETDFRASFPDPPVTAVHLVTNPGFEVVPLPFVPPGWAFVCAHWSARPSASGSSSIEAETHQQSSSADCPEREPEGWTGSMGSDSLRRGGHVAEVLCFRYSSL